MRREKGNLGSQILECTSIVRYWNIPVSFDNGTQLVFHVPVSVDTETLSVLLIHYQ